MGTDCSTLVACVDRSVLQAAANLPRTTIPAGQYFVMGDCRGDFDDSRYWGTVPATNIIGKVSAVICATITRGCMVLRVATAAA